MSEGAKRGACSTWLSFELAMIACCDGGLGRAFHARPRASRCVLLDTAWRIGRSMSLRSCPPARPSAGEELGR